MKQGVLVLNAGSSSLKFALYQCEHSASGLLNILKGQIAGIGNQPEFNAVNQQGSALSLIHSDALHDVKNHIGAIELVLNWLHQQAGDIELIGVGHRVVHGGQHLNRPALINDKVISKIESLCPLAPHHQPHNLSAIHAVRKMNPELPQVACFDTAFHALQPDVARRLALPYRYQEKGLMRYGFHGLSYEYITSALPGLNNAKLPERLIVAHLGNGASLCAVKQGISIATTMGFSTLDGVLMGTRSGSIDPGVLLYLMHEENMTADELTDLVYNQCGLLGLSGISSDMQVLLNSYHLRAQQAVESFCYSIVQSIGSLMATLEGIDGLVFTGGIGEHAAEIRRRICHKLEWQGLKLDEVSNQHDGPLISSAISAIPVWVIPADEESVIASHTLAAIQDAQR